MFNWKVDVERWNCEEEKSHALESINSSKKKNHHVRLAFVINRSLLKAQLNNFFDLCQFNVHSSNEYKDVGWGFFIFLSCITSTFTVQCIRRSNRGRTENWWVVQMKLKVFSFSVLLHIGWWKTHALWNPNIYVQAQVNNFIFITKWQKFIS